MAAILPWHHARERSDFTIVFMGTPQFAVPTLDALVAAGHDVVAVYTQPPRPAGRGGRPRSSSVHDRAASLGIEVRHPASLRPQEEIDALVALRADWIVVAAYGLILPQAVLAAPRHGCLNVHGSLLPRWRGAAPVQRAIMAGDAETGICIMDMERGLDTGPVRLRGTLPLEGMTAGRAMDALSFMGARLMVEVLADPAGHPPVPQLGEGVTYAEKIDKREARLYPALSAIELARTVMAMSPSPGAWIEVQGERIRVLCADAVEGAGEVGRFVDGRMTLACGNGLLRIHRAQRPGKSPLHPEDLVAGFPIPAGTAVGGSSPTD